LQHSETLVSILQAIFDTVVRDFETTVSEIETHKPLKPAEILESQKIPFLYI